MWYFFGAFVSVLAALSSFLAAAYIYIHGYKYVSEFQEVQHRLNKMKGRIAQKSGTSKKVIREAVEEYMEENEVAQGGGSGMDQIGEMMLPMLMQQFMGGQGQEEPEQVPEDTEDATRWMRGSGGVTNGEETEPTAGS